MSLNSKEIIRNMQINLIFVRIIRFMLFTVLLSIMYDTLFQRIPDSRIMSIHDLLTEPVGLVPFSAEYLICEHIQTHGRMDRWTDRRMDRRTEGWDGRTDRQINPGSLVKDP